MTIQLRRFFEADRAASVDLIQELNSVEYGITGDRLTDRGTAEAYLAEAEAAVASRDAVILVATASEAVVGLMVWAPHCGDIFIAEEHRTSGWIEDIVVSAAHRGQGIGQLFLAEAARLTRERGLKHLRLSVLAGNDGAEAAYRRFGFRHYATTMVKDFD